jgi:hypothetical protein
MRALTVEELGFVSGGGGEGLNVQTPTERQRVCNDMFVAADTLADVGEEAGVGAGIAGIGAGASVEVPPIAVALGVAGIGLLATSAASKILSRKILNRAAAMGCTRQY